ncbi:MAG: FAD binding domain-containing protein [Acidobacteriota bacterium]
MRAYLPAYDLRAPETLKEALKILAQEPGTWRPFAGGTDLMVLFEAGRLPEGRYLGLWKLRELGGIEDRDDAIVLGALTTYTDVLSHPTLQQQFPLLCRAAAETGGVATQNRGTIGGNIANASPAADTPPALLVYDAALELVSVRGTRRVPYDMFHLGYKKMDLAADELIARIVLPKRPSVWRQYYRKVGTRRAQAISKVCLAAEIDLDEGRGHARDVRIAFGSVAPVPLRARQAEAALRGRPLDGATLAAAQQALASDISPIDDLRSTARYRLAVAQNLLGECLETVRVA